MEKVMEELEVLKKATKTFENKALNIMKKELVSIPKTKEELKKLREVKINKALQAEVRKKPYVKKLIVKESTRKWK